ncbi:hypothetical protein D3C83_156260 [compost metagenome]
MKSGWVQRGTGKEASARWQAALSVGSTSTATTRSGRARSRAFWRKQLINSARRPADEKRTVVMRAAF